MTFTAKQRALFHVRAAQGNQTMQKLADEADTMKKGGSERMPIDGMSDGGAVCAHCGGKVDATGYAEGGEIGHDPEVYHLDDDGDEDDFGKGAMDKNYDFDNEDDPAVDEDEAPEGGQTSQSRSAARLSKNARMSFGGAVKLKKGMR